MSGKLGAKPKISKEARKEILIVRQQVVDSELLRSLQKFFEGLCMCAGCLKTANSRKNPSYPHWFGKTSTAAKFIKKILLEGVKHTREDAREDFITAFNTLVGDDHGGLSDIIHMSKITIDELSTCIERLSAVNKNTATYLELFHLLLMCSWKTDSLTVDFIFFSKQVC